MATSESSKPRKLPPHPAKVAPARAPYPAHAATIAQAKRAPVPLAKPAPHAATVQPKRAARSRQIAERPGRALAGATQRGAVVQLMDPGVDPHHLVLARATGDRCKVVEGDQTAFIMSSQLQRKNEGEQFSAHSCIGKDEHANRYFIITDEAVVVSESMLYDLPLDFTADWRAMPQGVPYQPGTTLVTRGVGDCIAVLFEALIDGHRYFYFGHWSTHSYGQPSTGEAPVKTQAVRLFEWFKGCCRGQYTLSEGLTCYAHGAGAYDNIDLPRSIKLLGGGISSAY